MIAPLYQNFILKNPKAIFTLLIIAILSFGYYTKDFRLDASSDTLLIEGDPDLTYLKEISRALSILSVAACVVLTLALTETNIPT